jgi:hypothetical protein
MDHHVAGEGNHIANPGLALGFKLDGHTGRWCGLGLGDWKNFLAGVVWKVRGKAGRGSVAVGRAWRGKWRIGRRLPPQLEAAEGQHRDQQ